MNTTWRIIFGVMVFVTLTSFVYAFVQQTVAGAQLRLAEAARVEADQNAAEAMGQRNMAETALTKAEEQRAEADRQRAITLTVMEQLEQCQQKKR